MQRKIWKIFSIISVSFVIVILATLTFLFFSFSFPNTKVKINLVSISPEKMLLNVSVNVENPNLFPIIIKELKAKIIGDDKYLAEFPLTTGEVSAKNSKNFYGNHPFSFKEEIPKMLTIIINGKIGTKIVGIKKLVNVSSYIDVLLSSLQKISMPSINLEGNIKEINEEGVILHYSASIYNPNFYGLTGKNLFLCIKGKNKEIYNNSLEEFNVSSNQTVKIEDDLTLPWEILNYDNISIYLKGKISINVGGVKKDMKIGTETKIKVPKLNEIFSMPTYKIIDKLENFEVISTNPPTVHIKTNISIEVNNKNSYPIEIDDIKVTLYAVYFLTEEKIGEGFINGGIAGANNKTTLYGSFTADIVLFQFWPPFPRTDKLHFRIETSMGIPKVEQKIPIEIDFYQVIPV